MNPYEIMISILSLSSLSLCLLLLITTLQLRGELDQLKQSTRLTREELERINERLKRIKAST